MSYVEVGTLKLANGFVIDFIIGNGVEFIPQWWAFIIETCGLLSWVIIFLIFVSVMVGYSRQMSGFFFFYEHVLKQKMNNPYKPALLFLILLFSLYFLSFSVSVAGVYFYKYGYIYAILIGVAAFIVLVGLAYFWVFVYRHKPEGYMMEAFPEYNEYEQTRLPNQPMQNMHVRYDDGEKHKMLSHVNKGSFNRGEKPSDGNISPHNVQIFEESLAILGLNKNYTKAQLNKKYRVLIKKVHADSGGSDGLYIKVKSCYEYLLKFVS